MTSVINRTAPLDHADDPAEPVGVRIGELSRRVGVSTELLRAWERRYQLLQPARSPKGYRLYTTQDELRVRAMQDQLTRGLSAAEAARVARRAAPSSAAYPSTGRRSAAGQDPTLEESDTAMRLYRALERALDTYDESDAQHLVDTMLRELSLTTVLRDIVMPYLAELGERWESGTIDVAQEHFASNLIRGRLAGLALGWGQGVGPRAVIACPKGELHDLPLMVFGIVLNRCGWRVTFLGNNTPVSDLDSAVRHLRPQVVVLAATTSAPFLADLDTLRSLAGRVRVALAGAGATDEIVAATGAMALRGDPVTEALHLDVPVAVGAGA
ncbi:MAG TPA: cobalamin B12-binding domain-containing protein [Lapillicoccus sp.]|nr:cobalamin B12-binding domain-containing protein [Lapillicoccus sp.]